MWKTVLNILFNSFLFEGKGSLEYDTHLIDCKNPKRKNRNITKNKVIKENVIDNIIKKKEIIDNINKKQEDIIDNTNKNEIIDNIYKKQDIIDNINKKEEIIDNTKKQEEIGNNDKLESFYAFKRSEVMMEDNDQYYWDEATRIEV